MTAEPLEFTGIAIACAAAATAILAPTAKLRNLAIAIALVAAPLIVLGDVWNEPRVVDLRESPVRIAAGLIVGAALLAGLVLVFRRWPQAFPIAVFAALPLRVPIEVGGENANLLVPLYLVIAAGFVVQLPKPAAAPREGGRRVVALRWLLAATLVLYAVQSIYSEDVSNAIESIGFFLVPFAVMFTLLLAVEWSLALLGRILVAVAVVAAATALVGIGQFIVRDLFLNPELFDANQLHQYFRVNSIFFDPNIFGRYLALALTALGAYLAWNVPATSRDTNVPATSRNTNVPATSSASRPGVAGSGEGVAGSGEGEAGSAAGRRGVGLAVLAAGIALAGLTLSYSITGFVALLAGLGMVALLRWSWRGGVAAAGLGLVALVALVIAGGTPTSDIQTDRNIDSGHFPLVKGGLILAGVVDDPEEIRCECDPGEPLVGWGSGAFGAAFYENIEPARTAVSHSEPITVAAEQGIVGFLLYLALLLASVAVLLGRRAWLHPGRAAAAACFTAILIHSFGYTGFLIDPATWALLALGVALYPRDAGDRGSVALAPAA